MAGDSAPSMPAMLDPQFTSVVMRNYALIVLCESALWGLYTALVAFALYVLWSRRQRSYQNTALLLVTVTMYALATTDAVLSIRQSFQALIDTRGIVDAKTGKAFTQMLLAGCNYLLGDLVVIWRVYLLFDRSLLPCALPFALHIGAVSSLIVEGFLQSSHFFPFSLSPQAPLSPWLTAFNVLSFATTLCSTLMIGIKTRMHRRSVIPYLSKSTTGTRILLFMVESGALYCLLWGACVIIFLRRSYTYIILFSVSSQVIGIFPTAILIAATVILDRPPAIPSLARTASSVDVELGHVRRQSGTRFAVTLENVGAKAISSTLTVDGSGSCPRCRSSFNSHHAEPGEHEPG